MTPPLLRRLALVRRVGAFVFLPFLSSLAPFLLLPLLARRVSAGEWAGLGIGQSIGMVGAIAVTWGWQFLGPVLVAGAEMPERQARYLDSLLVRGSVALVLTPVLAGISALVAPTEGRALGVAMAVAICLSGLTPAWYFIGLGAPGGIARWDIVPRVGATVVSALLVLKGVDAVCYPVLLALAGLIAVAVFSVRELRGMDVRKRVGELRRLVPELRRGFIPMATEMTLSLYSSGSVAFVGWRASTETVAVYSSAFRLYRLGLYFLMAMANGLQGWVAEKHGKERGRRMLVALQAHTAVGVLGLVATVALMPWISTLLFGPTLAVDRVSSFFIGLTLMSISIGLALGRHILIPEGVIKGVWWPTLIGAMIGIPLSVVLPQEWGTAGATAALCVSQIVTLLLFVPRAVRVLRRVLRGEEIEDDVTPRPSPVATR